MQIKKRMQVKYFRGMKTMRNISTAMKDNSQMSSAQTLQGFITYWSSMEQMLTMLAQAWGKLFENFFIRMSYQTKS